MSTDAVIAEMTKLYGGELAKFGDDARSFFHNDAVSQYERFAMLGRLFANESQPFTVHEIGCSLGHFGDYLQEQFPLARFSGSDILPQFVEICRQRFPKNEFFVRDISRELPAERYDYVVTCGTFNIIGTAPRHEWQAFVYRMASAMYALSTKGVGLTFLTSYYEPGKDRADLFYQDEKELMDFTVHKLSRHFELDELGPLYEYGWRVYHPEYVRIRYPQAEFSKYFKKK